MLDRQVIGNFCVLVLLLNIGSTAIADIYYSPQTTIKQERFLKWETPIRFRLVQKAQAMH